MRLNLRQIIYSFEKAWDRPTVIKPEAVSPVTTARQRWAIEPAHLGFERYGRIVSRKPDECLDLMEDKRLNEEPERFRSGSLSL